MFLYGFILAVCYIPGVTGFALPTGWLVLSATLPFILRRDLLRCLNPFLLWATLGLGWTMIWQQGVYDVWKLALLSGVFVLAQTRDTSQLLRGMALGLGVSTVVAMFQLLGYHPLPSIYAPPAGLFFNPNVYGEIACLLTVWFLASGAWPWALACIPGVFLSQSRTALFTLAALAALWTWRRWPLAGPLAIFATLLVLLPSVASKPGAGFPYRLTIWQNTIAGFTPLGRGPGSFIITSPAFATHTDSMTSREEDAHNDFLQIAYQYGIPGAAFLCAVVGFALWGPLGPDRYLLLAFLAIAAFNFPLEIPLEACLGALALGRLCPRGAMVRAFRLLRRWSLRGRLALSQLPDDPNRREDVPLEPIHSHPAWVLRPGLRRSF